MPKRLYPESIAKKVWHIGDVTLCIAQHPKSGHHCGYVRLPGRYSEHLGADEVEAHGGVTYHAVEGDTTVIGFDTGHLSDRGRPERQDMGWLTEQTEIMHRSAIEIVAAQSILDQLDL